MSGSSSPPHFTFNVNAVGGGSGGSSPGHASGDSGKNKNQDQGRGTTNPGQNSMLIQVVKRGRLQFYINKGEHLKLGNGYLQVAETTRIPRRIIFTTHGFHYAGPNHVFTTITDALLVPISFNQEKCSDLYLPPFFSLPLLRDNIILLLRNTIHGTQMGHTATECDIPENIQNRTDYRLVVTCPTLFGSNSENIESSLGSMVVLEMEFDS